MGREGHRLSARRGFLLLALLASLARAEVAPDWHGLSPAEFARRPELSAPIDFGNFNRELMAAAIFHETNRVRLREGGKAFRHLAKLDDAADLQASIGSLLPGLSHHNPLPNLASVSDRVQSVGLVPQSVAENIALTMALDGNQQAASVGVRDEDGRRVFYDPATNRTLKPLTYGAFAAVVVEQWMNSPGHRANILDPDLLYLGCSARWRKEFSGMDLIYSAQVFFVPGEKPGPMEDPARRIKR